MITSTQVWKILVGVYSDFTKKGEKIEEFNLCPEWYAKFKRGTVKIQGKDVKIVCRNWIEINGHEYFKINDTHYTTQYTIHLIE